MLENRRHPRVGVELKVRYGSRGDLQRDLVTDMSPGGVFVRTTEPLPVGTVIALEFVIPPNGLSISVEGKVMWLGNQKGTGGMGIRFTGVLGSVLADMVEEARREMAGASAKRA
jgi:uncharacterized protein (TIGR02266 family)